MIDIKKDFLKKQDINKLNDLVLSNLFEWFIQGVYDDNDTHRQFVHIFYKNDKPSSYHFTVIRPLLDKLNKG